MYTPDDDYADEWVLERVSEIPDINLSVTPIRQETTSTCGSACGRMLLSKFGISVSEATFKNRVLTYDSDYTNVTAIAKAINYFFTDNNNTIRYKVPVLYIGGYTESQFYTLVYNALNNGYPLEIAIKIPNTTYFQYTTNGHYVLIKGIYYISSTNQYILRINDPHYNTNYPMTINVPMSVIQSYNKAHSGYIIAPSI